MRIAFITNQFPALSETFILYQIIGMIDMGHSVDIFAQSSGTLSNGESLPIHPIVNEYRLLDKTYFQGELPLALDERVISKVPEIIRNLLGAPQSTLKSLNFIKYGRSALSLRLFHTARPFLNHQQFDIIHCHYGHNGLKAVNLREKGLLSGKIITSFHGFDVNVIEIIERNNYEELFSKGDLFLVNSSFTKERVITLGCPSEKIVKHPVGFRVSDFSFDPRVYEFGDFVQVLTVARLVEKKGLEYAVRAIHHLHQKGLPIHYRIAGDGPLRGSLEGLIQELNLSSHIELLGWQTRNEVIELYRKAHIFLLPSVTATNGDREGQGLVLQEAQATGLPVVATFHNGFPDSILDGESGFLVPERDVEALAEKLEFLVTHPELWSKMGRSGRDFVTANFDIDILNRELELIYRYLLFS